MEGGFEEILQSVLSDPEKMQQIMGLAQSLGGGLRQPDPEGTPSEPEQPAPDPGAFQQISGLLRQTEIDSNQQALLSALTPYMSPIRVRKLRRAMQAAKMAELAATVLGQGQFAGG